VGAGLGHTFYDYGADHLDLGIGATYVRDSYQDQDTTGDPTFLTSLNWGRRLGKGTTFSERLMYYPRFSDWQDYRVESDFKLDHSLGSSLSLTLGVIDRFDHTPLAGKVENDLMITSALTKRF
jgi:putative salt-induced outer membrane protein YdiY